MTNISPNWKPKSIRLQQLCKGPVVESFYLKNQEIHLIGTVHYVPLKSEILNFYFGKVHPLHPTDLTKIIFPHVWFNLVYPVKAE
jgi:hypothetical protein